MEKRTGHTAAPAPGKSRFELPHGVTLDDGLTEDEAVAIALWNNAALHADLATLGLARADLIDAGLLRNPILQLVLPLGPYKQFESTLSFPLEVFWQRRRRVEAATIEVERVAQNLEQNALNLMRDARLAYTDFLLAQERVRLNADAVDLRQQIVKLTDVRLRVGDVSEIESIAARLDQSLAAEQAVRFAREVIQARDRLRHLLGMGEGRTESKLQSDSSQIAPASFSSSGSSSGKIDAPEKIDEMLRTAYESRPDLRAAGLAIEVAAKRARWERSRIATLAALLNIKQGEGLGFSPRPGLAAELPVFNRNQGGISRADAEVERATWQYLAVRQRITLEVQEAYNQLVQSLEALSFWRGQIIPQAEESVRLSNKAFTSGDQSYLFVLDATRRFVEVRGREAELRADVRRAVAQLDRSIGRKFDAKP
ncbi:MAG: TolC family protein [Acidobacteria bacterium]|nr:TolC family protein [Acidobacteriota bacterium]